MVDRDEKRIEKALFKGTEEATELKDMVWSNIEKRLNFNEGKVVEMKQKKRGFMKYGSIAAALVVILLANTQYGKAAVDEIRKLFAPQKTIEQQLEGTGEKTDVDLKTSPMKYVIYIDQERYTMENLDGKDIIKAKNMPAGYPEVNMTIEQILDKKPEVVAAETEKALKSEFKSVKNIGKVSTPIDSLMMYAVSGSKPSDKFVKYYFIDNTKGGTFVIRQQYFVEAEEGHGARLDNMLKEFKIVNQ